MSTDSEQDGRSVNINVGRNLDVGGDLVGGDKVGGDKITAGGDITITHGVPIDDIEDLPPEPGDPPYKGLSYFTEADADRFFGREAATAELVNRLHEQNLLFVIGASGSGKSSLVRAGLIPVLKGNKTPANGPALPPGIRQVHTLAPTTRPLTQLAATLYPNQADKQSNFIAEAKRTPQALRHAATHLPTTQAVPTTPQFAELLNLVRHDADLYAALQNALGSLPTTRPVQHLLVIDQFEETFTLCKEEATRVAFIHNLVTAVHPDFKIVITMRADFYPHCLRYEPLRRLLKEAQEPIGAMMPAELAEAIVQPAVRDNWKLQEGLVETMLNDVGTEPGALPLLSHALLETWRRRRGRTMTLSGYRAAGGVRGAIATTAEQTYQTFSDKQKTIARRIFIQLTELGAEGAQDTRRRVDRAVLDDSDEMQAVVNQLVAARLITTHTDSVDVAHEALIREWPRLREWVDADRQMLLVIRRLANAAAEWDRHGRDDGLLYRGFRLTEAMRWTADRSETLNEQTKAFLTASTQAAAKQRAAEERRRKMLAELDQQQRMRRAVQATKLAFMAESELARDPELALLLATAGLGLNTQADTQAAFLRAATTHYRGTLHGHEGRIGGIDFHPTEPLIATVGHEDRTVRVWVLPGRLLTTIDMAAEGDGTLGYNTTAAFTPDGTAVLIGEYGYLQRWGVDGTRQADFNAEAQEARNIVFRRWEEDGSWSLKVLSVGWERTRVLDDHGREEMAFDYNFGYQQDLPVLGPHGRRIAAVDFTADEISVYEPDGTVMVTLSFDADRAIETVVFDGREAWLALLDKESRTTVWRLADGAVSALMDPQEDAYLETILFSPTVSLLLLVAYDEHGFQRLRWEPDQAQFTSRVFDQVGTGEEGTPLAVFHPHGRLLATATLQKTQIYLYEIDEEDGFTDETKIDTGHRAPLTTMQFAADGRLLATADESGQIRLWSPDGYAPTADLPPADTFAFSPDSRLIAAYHESELRLYDTDGILRHTITLADDEHIFSVAFSPDGTHIATLDNWSNGRVWDTTTGEPLHTLTSVEKTGPFHINGSEASIRYAPDGRHLLVRDRYDNPTLWTADGTHIPLVTPTDDAVWADHYAFTADGRYLLTADPYALRVWRMDGTVRTQIGSVDEDADDHLEYKVDPHGHWMTAISQNAADDPARPWLLTIYTSSGEVQVADVPIPAGELYFAPDGRRLLLGTDECIYMYEAHTGRETAQLEMKDSLGSVEPLADGNRILTYDFYAERVGLWDADGTHLTDLLLDGTERVVSVTVSADRQWVFTIDERDRATVWNSDGIPFLTIPTTVDKARLSPDGNWLLTIDPSGHGRLWPLYAGRAQKIELARRRLGRAFTTNERARFFRDDRAACPMTLDELFALFDPPSVAPDPADTEAT